MAMTGPPLIDDNGPEAECEGQEPGRLCLRRFIRRSVWTDGTPRRHQGKATYPAPTVPARIRPVGVPSPRARTSTFEQSGEGRIGWVEVDDFHRDRLALEFAARGAFVAVES